MSDTTTETVAAETSGDNETTEATATAATAETTATPEGEAALGDAGKKALDAMKAKWKEAEKQAKETAERLAAIQAKLDGKEAEHAEAQKARELEAAALSKANERILKAELRVAAKGKLTDPTDVFRFPEIVDLSAFEVSADGEVDADALEAAVNDLIARRPDLAAQGGKKFTGSPDGGVRNGSTLSIDDQIAEATKQGNHALAISLKRQKAYADRT